MNSNLERISEIKKEIEILDKKIDQLEDLKCNEDIGSESYQLINQSLYDFYFSKYNFNRELFRIHSPDDPSREKIQKYADALVTNLNGLLLEEFEDLINSF